MSSKKVNLAVRKLFNVNFVCKVVVDTQRFVDKDNPHLYSSEWAALKHRLSGSEWKAKFLYFFIKDLIKEKKSYAYVRDEVEKILFSNNDILLRFILNEYKKTKIYSNERIQSGTLRTILAKINDRLQKGEKYYVKYKKIRNYNPNNPIGVLDWVKNGGKVIWSKDKPSIPRWLIEDAREAEERLIEEAFIGDRDFYEKTIFG